jgi:hypothetical protein
MSLHHRDCGRKLLGKEPCAQNLANWGLVARCSKVTQTEGLPAAITVVQTHVITL